MSDFLTLEELSNKHEKSYNEYNRSYPRRMPAYIRSMFSANNCIYDYKSIMSWYRGVRHINIGEECVTLNKKLNVDDHNFPVLDIATAHRIYVLKRVTDEGIVGLIDVYCYNDECLNMVVPSLKYEISPKERDKGYGTELLRLMLENNDIEIDTFYARIYSCNYASIRLIKSFNPKEIGTSSDIQTVRHFELSNTAYQKKKTT